MGPPACPPARMRGHSQVIAGALFALFSASAALALAAIVTTTRECLPALRQLAKDRF
jgi:hypothetical protein